MSQLNNKMFFSKKGQSAIEFLILIVGVFFFFTIFFGIIQSSMADKQRERTNLILLDTTKSIQQEIELASESTEGYQRIFELPEFLAGKTYNASVDNTQVYVRTLDEKYAMALPIPKVNGQLVIGNNTIRKTNGEVYLN